MKRVFMKTILILGAALLVLSLTGCDALLGAAADWLSAPYGYVYDFKGTGVEGAKVKVYLGSAVDATKLVQSEATTTSTGFFSLTSKVDTKGGTYLVVVTPPANSTLTFENVLVKVPDTGYLFNIGTIKPKGGLYTISGKLINVRAAVSATSVALPIAGNVEVRKFGATTVTATAAIGADGTYSVPGIGSGSYLVTFKDTATTATWVGIPISVEIAGGDVTGVGALVYTGVPATAMLLVLTWDNKNYDIDSFSYVGVMGSAVVVKFGALTLNDVNGNKVTLERDVQLSDINSTTSPAYPAETTLVESLALNTELRFYAKAYTTVNLNASVSGVEGTTVKMPAGVKLYAMFNKQHYGTWTAPQNTDESAVGLVQIRGDAGGGMTIGTYGWNQTTEAKSLTPVYAEGAIVSEMK